MGMLMGSHTDLHGLQVALHGSAKWNISCQQGLLSFPQQPRWMNNVEGRRQQRTWTNLGRCQSVDIHGSDFQSSIYSRLEAMLVLARSYNVGAVNSVY